MAQLKKINMDQYNADPGYRYQFEPLLTRVKGRNTGKRTLLVNIVQIADDILGVKMEQNSHGGRYSQEIITKTAQHIIAFIGKRVGVQAKYDKARKAGWISGEKPRNELQSILFEYVAEYARCPHCKNEELTPAVLGNVQCKSCGHDKQTAPKKKGGKRDKKESRRKKQAKKKQQKPRNEDEHDEMKANEAEEEEEEEKEDKQVQQRVRSDPNFAFKYYVTQNPDACSEDVMEKIKVLSLAHTMDRKQQIKMIMYGLMQYEGDDYKSLMQSIRKYRTIFEAFTLLNNDTQIFLAYMEEIIMHKATGDNLLNHSYNIFNSLYDEDIVGEDEIMEWYQSKPAQNPFAIVNANESELIRNKTKPFIEWLENAENDASEEED